MKIIIMFFSLFIISVFASSCLANTEYNLNNVVYEYENAMYDKVTVGNNSYYFPHKDFIFVLNYIVSLKEFDSISTNPIEYHKRWYKFDVFEENGKIYIILSNFIDEQNGIEDTIVIHEKYKEIHEFLKYYG